MKIYKHRTKNVVVIKCENQAEKSALCRYPFNIDLQNTSEPMTFCASIKNIPISEFEEFKKDAFELLQKIIR